MPNKIKPKRSYTANSVPTTSDLETHELAINWVDNKAFTKNAAGQIVSVTLGGGGGGGAEDPRWEYFKPAAPTGVTATATNAQAVVSWTAPAVVVPPVTDYVVQYSTNSGSTWTTFTDAVSTATSATVTGLTNGTAHVFRVAAVNGIGTGAYSTASAAVTPTAGDPLFSSVALLLRMDGTGSTFVDSSATPKTITAAGGTTQTTAQSKWGGKSAAFGGNGDYLSVPSITLSGDFVFECWLRWNGAIGRDFSWITGGPDGTSSQFFLLTKQNRTGLRFGMTGVAESGTGSFTWIPDTWYHVALVRSSSAIRFYVNGVNITDGSPTDSNTFTGEMRLGADGSGSYDSNFYLDDVRLTVGNNRSYTGATITVPTAAFPDGAMSAPTSLTATGGNAQVSLAWTAPSYNGGSAITDYSVQFSSNSGSTWTTFSRTASTTASQVVTGLTNGTAYVFRVAGINANGTGTYTEASSSVTPVAESVPGAPTNLRRATTHWACGNDNEIAWDAPVSNGGSAITGYRWRINASGATTLVSPASGSRDQATNYTGGVVLGLPTGGSFQVAAVNAVGIGSYASITLQGDCN